MMCFNEVKTKNSILCKSGLDRHKRLEKKMFMLPKDKRTTANIQNIVKHKHVCLNGKTSFRTPQVKLCAYEDLIFQTKSINLLSKLAG